MKALIFNSGMGTRMGASEKPKCMADLGGRTIIELQLRQLLMAGISDVVITTGHLADMLKAHISALDLPVRIEYVHNPLYSSTNYIYSMCLAAPLFEPGTNRVLMLHGDIVCEQSVMEEMVKARGSAVAVDRSLPLPLKDFKALIMYSEIHRIGVKVFGKNAVACQPVYRFAAPDFDAFMDKVTEFCDDGDTGVYAENALNTLLPGLGLKPFYLRGRLCQEVDTPEDLDIVKARLVL